MPNSADFCKGIFLHIILVRMIVPWSYCFFFFVSSSSYGTLPFLLFVLFSSDEALTFLFFVLSLIIELCFCLLIYLGRVTVEFGSFWPNISVLDGWLQLRLVTTAAGDLLTVHWVAAAVDWLAIRSLTGESDWLEVRWVAGEGDWLEVHWIAEAEFGSFCPNVLVSF